jgi:hypothetical protein
MSRRQPRILPDNQRTAVHYRHAALESQWFVTRGTTAGPTLALEGFLATRSCVLNSALTCVSRSIFEVAVRVSGEALRTAATVAMLQCGMITQKLDGEWDKRRIQLCQHYRWGFAWLVRYASTSSRHGMALIPGPSTE